MHRILSQTDCSNEYEYLAGNKGKFIYSLTLIFCLIYSLIVYGLQFVGDDAKYVYIYLTNWTFTLFLISITLNSVELTLPQYWLTKTSKIVIFNVSLITKPVYIYVCLVYSISLTVTLTGVGNLLSAEHIGEIKKNALFYFNDISKHFIFVALLIVLFTFTPRNNDNDFTYKWWKFIYSFVFVCIYLGFSAIYYVSTNKTKVYNLSSITICVLMVTMPLTLFIIHYCFKLSDGAIRRRLFH